MVTQLSYGLKNNERKLLGAVQHCAKERLSSISRELGLHPSAGRYALKGLKSRGVIDASLPFVNLCRLGFNYYSLLFNFSECTPALRDRALRYFLAHSRVTWMGEYSGNHRYGITLIARGPKELSCILREFTDKLGCIFLNKEIVSKLQMTFFPRKYLSEATTLPLQTFHYESEDSEVAIDETDHRILSQMIQSKSTNVTKLSRLLDEPESTIRLRLERLQSVGVVGGLYYDLNTEKLQVRSFVTLIYTSGLSSDVISAFESYCQQSPYVTFLVYSVGAWDCEVGFECPNTATITQTFNDLETIFATSVERIQSLELLHIWRRDPYPLKRLT